MLTLKYSKHDLSAWRVSVHNAKTCAQCLCAAENPATLCAYLACSLHMQFHARAHTRSLLRLHYAPSSISHFANAKRSAYTAHIVQHIPPRKTLGQCLFKSMYITRTTRQHSMLCTYILERGRFSHKLYMLFQTPTRQEVFE